MPYAMRKIRGKDLYKVFNKETKEVHSKGSTREDAKKQLRLLRSLERKEKKKMEGGSKTKSEYMLSGGSKTKSEYMLSGGSKTQSEYDLSGGALKNEIVDKVDFEDIDWGSLKKQMSAYNTKNKANKVKDLEQFAKLILKDGSKFREKTKKRARFYLNVILKKGKSGGSAYLSGGCADCVKKGCKLCKGKCECKKMKGGVSHSNPAQVKREQQEALARQIYVDEINALSNRLGLEPFEDIEEWRKTEISDILDKIEGVDDNVALGLAYILAYNKSKKQGSIFNKNVKKYYKWKQSQSKMEGGMQAADDDDDSVDTQDAINEMNEVMEEERREGTQPPRTPAREARQLERQARIRREIRRVINTPGLTREEIMRRIREITGQPRLTKLPKTYWGGMMAAEDSDSDSVESDDTQDIIDDNQDVIQLINDVSNYPPDLLEVYEPFFDFVEYMESWGRNNRREWNILLAAAYSNMNSAQQARLRNAARLARIIINEGDNYNQENVGDAAEEGDSDMEDRQELVSETGRPLTTLSNVQRPERQEGSGYSGGEMSADDIQDLLRASYDKDIKDIGDYRIDPEVSDERVKAYVNDKTGKVYSVHRGSADWRDWLDNYNLVRHGNFRASNTYKKHKAKQDAIDRKYGKENLTLLGHSRAGKYVEELNDESKGKYDEVFTYNKATNWSDIGRKNKKNQYDIRTKYDPVSALRFLQRGVNKVITVNHKSKNPLKAHSPKRLSLFGKKLIGKGMSGGKFNPKKLRVKEMRQFLRDHHKVNGVRKAYGKVPKKAMVEEIKGLVDIYTGGVRPRSDTDELSDDDTVVGVSSSAEVSSPDPEAIAQTIFNIALRGAVPSSRNRVIRLLNTPGMGNEILEGITRRVEGMNASRERKDELYFTLERIVSGRYSGAGVSSSKIAPQAAEDKSRPIREHNHYWMMSPYEAHLSQGRGAKKVKELPQPKSKHPLDTWLFDITVPGLWKIPGDSFIYYNYKTREAVKLPDPALVELEKIRARDGLPGFNDEGFEGGNDEGSDEENEDKWSEADKVESVQDRMIRRIRERGGRPVFSRTRDTAEKRQRAEAAPKLPGLSDDDDGWGDSDSDEEPQKRRKRNKYGVSLFGKPGFDKNDRKSPPPPPPPASAAPRNAPLMPDLF